MSALKKNQVKRGDDILTPQKMVKWYDLEMLASTAFQVSVSSIFGKFADTRETFSRLLKPTTNDYTNNSEDGLWLDYIADTGDGFDSTYTIAYLLQQNELTITAEDGSTKITLPRGRVLVLGGDEVYPVASHEAYMQKLWLPFECAFPNDNKELVIDEQIKNIPHVYAIPGNHDWYDGLSNFLKFFCQGRSLGGWKTQQIRSYFAMKLSSDLWFWGIDIQFEGDIDKLQLEYFFDVAINEMNDNDRLILCTAEPSWVHINTVEGKKRFAKLNFFINNCIENIVDKKTGKKRMLDLSLLISGDLHHYARYEPKEPGNFDNLADQCITAGGGGAFMHPTHNLDEELNVSTHLNLKLKKEACFPGRPKSAAMANNNFLFFYYNYTFSLLLAAFMLLIMLLTQSWSLIRGVNNEVINSTFDLVNHKSFINALGHLAFTTVITPPALLLLLVFGYGVFTFRDNVHGTMWKNHLFGFLHAVAHVIIGMILTIILTKWLFGALSIENGGAVELYFFLFIAYMVAGYFIHGFIFGTYLFIANRFLKCHDNEAFSHLAIADYKNIIKIHITNDGTIEIYPIGITKVCRNWNYDSNPGNEFGKPKITPKDPIECRLIEKKIEIKKTKQSSAGSN